MATCCCFWDFKEWVYYKREGKDGYLLLLLMHAFLPCLLSFLSTSPFLFSLLFLSQFSLFLALVAIPLPFMVTIPIYIGSSLWDFSILPLWFTNQFLSWFLCLHYIWACPIPSLSSTTHSLTNLNSFDYVMSLFPLERIRLWVSLYLPL